MPGGTKNAEFLTCRSHVLALILQSVLCVLWLYLVDVQILSSNVMQGPRNIES